MHGTLCLPLLCSRQWAALLCRLLLLLPLSNYAVALPSVCSQGKASLPGPDAFHIAEANWQ